jgi:hypothetical protein
LRRIDAELAARGRRFALIGGIAMSVRATVRLTQDVDLAVAVADDSDAEGLVKSLLAQGYRMLAQIEQEATGRLATVRLVDAADGVIVDLLFASSGIETEAAGEAERVEIERGFVIPVARREHLLAMKVLARNDRRRPQDHDDLVAMIQRAGPGEIQRAKEAMRLIESRGNARGKDLVAEFDALLAELGRST